MAERKKLELELNKLVVLELLFDECIKGTSRFGDYYLYNIKNGTDTEYSFFAPDDVHEKIKSLHKGDKFEIVKLAEQKGTKIITKHEVKILPKIKTEVDKKESIINKTQNNGKDSYFESMLNSYEDAIKIQEKLHGIIDINRVAISIFITRNRINGNGYN